MERTEKRLLDVITLGTIVIALSSLGSMATQLIANFGTLVLPLWASRVILAIIGWAALYYAIKTIVHYNKK